jgi:hypothetical protein
MFVSIAGHASFHTALRSGPSTIDLSYRESAMVSGGAGPGRHRARFPVCCVEPVHIVLALP